QLHNEGAMRILRLLLAISLLSLIIITEPSSSARVSLALTSAGQSGRTIEKDLQAMPGQKLRLNLETGGGVKISGWQSNLVSIKGYLGGREWEDCTGDIDEDLDVVKVTSRKTAGVNSYSTDFRFEIQVPQKFDVQIKSAGGEISVSNLDGEVKGSTGGGSLTITEAKGTVNLTTGGGNISVTRSEIDGRVSTGGGRILIQDVKGDFNGYSGGGNVELKNVTRRSGGSTGDEVHISNAGGSIVVDEAAAGADVRTGGGGIHIKSARGFVKASTGGGRIEIDAVDGAVHATTGAGAGHVHVTGSSEQGGRD